MIIRSQQMAVFARQASHDFERELQVYVRRTHGELPVHTNDGILPLSALAEQPLAALIRCAIKKASRYGITWESSVAAFTVLMFKLGPRFDEHPAIQQELSDPDVPENSLVDHLCMVIPDPVWEEVKAMYDRSSWALVRTQLNII